MSLIHGLNYTTGEQLPFPLSGSAPGAANAQVSAFPVVGFSVNPVTSFTRPADTVAYASGDLVANSTTAGSVAPMLFFAARITDGAFSIRRARLKKSASTTANATFNIHLFATSPSSTVGDNSPITGALSPSASYLGSIPVNTSVAFSDGAAGVGSPLVGSDITIKLTGGQAAVYALIEATGAYTPGSAEVFTLTLEVNQQ